MYTLYSFVEIPNFKDNEQGKTATIGELSAHARTFSTEVGAYSLNTYPEVTLESFDSRRDGSVVKVGLAYFDTLLHISQWLYDRAIQGAIGTDPVALKQALTAEFGTDVEFKSVGNIILKGNYRFPTYLEMTILNSGEDNTVYQWYANDTFIAQYPLKEYRIVLPVTPIDQLMGLTATSLALLRAITTESHNTKLQAAIGDKPQSYIWTRSFAWCDKDNSDITLPATFSAVINGIAGLNIDYIKDAIRKEILDNSEYGEDEWTKVFPELFTPTEFYIVPLWDRYSLPNQVRETGLYSPTVPVMPVLTQYAKKYFKGYDDVFIAQNMCVSSCIYKSSLFISCGNVQNYNAQTRFDLEWPAYAAINHESAEFSKLPPQTQTFIVQLIGLIQAAEAATATSLIPETFTRTLRDGVYYFTTTVDGVQYLVPIKDGFTVEG